MNKEIITASMPVRQHPARVTVLYEDGQPAEVHVEPGGTASDLGWIYLGRIDVIEPSLSAAFVRISDTRRVYLPLGKQQKHLHQGDVLPVQIIQEAQKTKLPKAAAAWEIAGEYIVLSEGTGGIAYSRRLTTEQKAALKPLAAAWKSDTTGILFRTKAGEVTENTLQDEYARLLQTVQDIRRRAETRMPGTVLYRAPGLQQRLISRCMPGELLRFMTDDRALAAALEPVCTAVGAVSVYYEDPQLALYRLRSLSTLLDRLTSVRVPLRSGGSLVIEQTEALTAIDVNSGRFTGKHTMEETVRHINREAAAEAARQIRLRQLSGTILIDFINMTDPQKERELADILRQKSAADPVYTKIVDFTALHICEITRKKTMRSLAEQIRAVTEAGHDAS